MCMVCGCGDAPATTQMGNQKVATLLYHLLCIRVGLCVSIYARGHMPWTCGGQKIHFVGLFSPSTVWGAGTEFRLLG